MEPTILTRNNKKRGTITQSLYFRTLAMPCLNYYYELFYKDNIKIIPNNLASRAPTRGALGVPCEAGAEELLTARGLAF